MRRRVVGALLGGAVLLLGGGVLVAQRVGGEAAPEVPLDIALTGDVRTHDPALVIDPEGSWWVFSTGDASQGGGAIQVRSSSDGHAWTYRGEIAPEERPEWIAEVVPQATNLWAPELHEHDGTWYLYYAASSFGSNRSAIGLMTSDSLDPDSNWVDGGRVIVSEPGLDDWNAIDPAVVEDAEGNPWLAFGSFWGGIQMIELSWPSGLPVEGAAPTTIAARGTPPNAIEAASFVQHDGWTYLLVSKDLCCRALASSYHVVVGRSREVTGPYLDAAGRPLLEDGGTALLTAVGDMVGPGGQSVADGYLAFHFYDVRLSGDFRLGVRRLGWVDGWPVADTGAAPAHFVPQG